jgi:hypothetical protein
MQCLACCTGVDGLHHEFEESPGACNRQNCQRRERVTGPTGVVAGILTADVVPKNSIGG